MDISIHGPRVGADYCTWNLISLSRISIHGPRVGADLLLMILCLPPKYFNPRPPCGGRRYISDVWADGSKFQSTAPVWGPTFWLPFDWCCY